MARARLLFIDDEPESVDPVINRLDEDKYEHKVVGFDSAKDQIENWLPDMVVLDLKAQLEDESFPGNEIYEWIWESRFLPIVVYSAFPAHFSVNYGDHPFVKRVQKGRTSVREVEAALAEFTPHMDALHQAEREMRKQFSIALKEVAPNAFQTFSPQESEKRNDMILRAGRRRLAASMDELSRHGQIMASWEQYLCPPVSEDLNLGDILREKWRNKDPNSFLIVLTPSCDLVASKGRKPKVKSVLMARCCAMDSAIQLTSLGNMGEKKLRERLPATVLSQGYFDTILPLPAFGERIPHMAANLRDLELVRFEWIKEHYEIVASIDSPFRELVAWAYMQVGCRPGLPDRDFAAWCEDILKVCKPVTEDEGIK